MSLTFLLFSSFLVSALSESPNQRNDEFRLPRNYYPTKQRISLKFLARDLRIDGNTEIFVNNTEPENYNEIVLNAFELQIQSLVVYSIRDNEELPSKFSLVPDKEKIVIQLTETKNRGKLKININFTSNVSLNQNDMGAYSPFAFKNRPPNGFVTLFQTSFARTVFPCFDEPHFRTVFQIHMIISQNPEGAFDRVLSNTKEIEISDNQTTSSSEESDTKVYRFGDTVPLPSYLVAFAVLNSTNYPMISSWNYFDINFQIFAENRFADYWLTDSDNLKTLRSVVDFTMSYCESRFSVPMKVSDKVDIVFTEIPKVTGGLSRPGLILLTTSFWGSPQNREHFQQIYVVLIHELIHAWTGSLMTNDWWSNYWLIEGLTTFFQSEVTRELIKFKRFTRATNAIDFNRDFEQFQVRQERESDLAKDFDSFFGIDESFYNRARGVVSHIDSAMGNTLMKCLGIIFRKFPFSSLSSKNVVKELTNCPFSTLNVTEFMRYWLFASEIPILKIYTDKRESSNKNQAHFSYTFLCNLTTIHEKKCQNVNSEFKPHFALVFRDVENHILQDAVMVRENNTRVDLKFDLEKHNLYFVNVHDQGNFLVHYPESVYEEFFEWIKKNIFEGKIVLPPFYKVFINDMFELSKRNIIHLKWTYEILQNQNRLMKAGILDENEIVEFEVCLQNEFFSELPDANRELLKFSCYWMPPTNSR